jgi:hypothetical protein
MIRIVEQEVRPRTRGNEVPEAVRITGAMQRVEEELEKLTGHKMQGPFE